MARRLRDGEQNQRLSNTTLYKYMQQRTNDATRQEQADESVQRLRCGSLLVLYCDQHNKGSQLS